MEHLGQRNKSHHFPFFPSLLVAPLFRPLPRYIFDFPLIRRSQLAPSRRSDDLFYYSVDLLAATVYWNPRRSEIMRQPNATRRDVHRKRVTKRIINDDETNDSSKASRETRAYTDNRISGFCCFAFDYERIKIQIN